jgi:large subunit ribosomal protein L40
MLYPSNLRNKPTPVGTWRPEVGRLIQRAIPSKQAHETIERAWNLHLRHTRWKREAELARKFECMRKAMEELEKIDSTLYMEANKVEDPRTWTAAELEKSSQLRGAEKRAFDWRIRGLFPRELRLPTDTPSRNGWDYQWKPLGESV